MSGLQLTVDGAPVDLSKTITYKGMMSERCPKPCFRLRLHERVLDVEMRPHGQVCLPAAEAHGPARLRTVHATRKPRAHGLILTLKAFANSSPGLLQPWVIVVGDRFYATLKGLRRRSRNGKPVATPSELRHGMRVLFIPRVPKQTLGSN
jgi:hypothetical protein